MKRILKTAVFAVIVLCCLIIPANAVETDEIERQLDEFKNTLSDEVREDMKELGVEDYLENYTDALTLSSVISLLKKQFSENARAPLSMCLSLLSVILLTAVLELYKDTVMRTSMQEVMGAVCIAAVTSALIVPLLSLFQSASQVIMATSNMMILYIPVMIALLTFSGKFFSTAGLYTTLMTAVQNVSLLSSRVITPLLSFYLALSISTSLTQRVRLQGFVEMLSKLIKWILVFSMTIFSALLSIKTFVTNTYDSLSSRAVRFSLSSFIPIVGASVSEAYRTVQGSVNILRSGVGVFVIIAAAVSFLPVLIKTMLYLASVSICKAVSDSIGSETISSLLSSVSGALSILIALLVSIASVFLVSTAMLLSMGGVP